MYSTDYLHITSPFIYILFVTQLKNFFKSYSSETRILLRKYHNINLSLLSLFMFSGMLIGSIQENKLDNQYAFFCKSYNNNNIMNISVNIFLWSKYIEWLDTLFLYLFNKPISWLQYTHHMTTALLTYLNYKPQVSPCSLWPMGINCLVHIPMYWYFAYPKGKLYQYRIIITKIQIIQHISVMILTFSTLYIFDDCKQNYYGNLIGFYLYVMYFSFFTFFYFKKY